jgi:hypothetical protein
MEGFGETCEGGGISFSRNLYSLALPPEATAV